MNDCEYQIKYIHVNLELVEDNVDHSRGIIRNPVVLIGSADTRDDFLLLTLLPVQSAGHTVQDGDSPLLDMPFHAILLFRDGNVRIIVNGIGDGDLQ